MAKKTLKAAVCAVLAILLAVGLCGCKIVVDGVDVTDYTSAQYTTYDFFNTYCTVACYLPQDKKDDLDKLWKGEITSALERVEGLLSQDGENSDVRAYNEATACETLEIDEITYDALSLAGQAYCGDFLRVSTRGLILPKSLMTDKIIKKSCPTTNTSRLSERLRISLRLKFTKKTQSFTL